MPISPCTVARDDIAMTEEDQCHTVGPQDSSCLGDRGPSDLVGIERLSDPTRESVDGIEVAQALVEEAVGLDDVPQHPDGDDREHQEPR